MATPDQTDRLLGIYYGWWVVAITFVINSLSTGVYFMGFAVFLLPISRDLHVSRAAASLPYALARLMGIVNGPMAGLAIERIGPTKLLFIAGLLAGTGFILLSWSPNYLTFLLVFVLIIATGIQGGLDTPGMVTVSHWFVKRRGVAFSMAQMGYAFGGAVVTPLLALGVYAIGWRTTAMVVGIVIFAIVLPFSTLLRKPTEANMIEASLPTESDTTRSPSPSSGNVSHDFTLREALRTRTYWFLAISYSLRAMAWSAFTVHLVGILTWKGIEESSAGFMLGLFPFFWMPANLLMGWLADRLPKHRVAAAGGFTAAVGMLSLLFMDNIAIWQVLLVFLILSPNEGSWALAWVMLSEQFGRLHFGLIRGGVLALFAVFSVGAPFYSGWIFDLNNSYLWVILPVAVILAVAGLLNWLTPPVKRRIPQPTQSF